MKIDILTLFPEMFDGFLNTSIIKRALDNKYVDIKVHNFRDYSQDKHKRVDDYPYGGGAGMVLMCEPIFRAIESLKTKDVKEVLSTLKLECSILILCIIYTFFNISCERIPCILDNPLSYIP